MPPPTPNSEEPHNAPFGARCFLTCLQAGCRGGAAGCLNAPFGARCFLTARRVAPPCGQGERRTGSPVAEKAPL